MSAARIRLVVATCLFAAWLGYLAYLVHDQPLTGKHPWWWVWSHNTENERLVVSQPQILDSSLDVIAEVNSDSKDAPVKVIRVLYAKNKEDRKLEGQEITVTNLAACRGAQRPAPTQREKPPPPPPPDYTGPGEYLLPLKPVKDSKTKFEVVPIPASPGYPVEGPPHIYPASKRSLAQYEKLLPEKKEGDS